MNKRKWIISLSGVLVFVIAIVIVKLLPDSDPSIKVKNSNIQTAVNTLLIQSDSVSSSFALSGRVIPLESIEVFAEVGGKASYTGKKFKVGNAFQKGESMLQIDDKEFRNSLLAQKSQFKSLLAQALADIKLDYPNQFKAWEAYLMNLKINQTLPQLPESDDEQLNLFLSGRNILSQYYKIKEAEERLEKYSIKAPFNGSITNSRVNEGALIRIGQSLGEFISNADFELETSVELDMLKHLKIGKTVEFQELNGQRSFAANLIRINNKIDPANQLVKVYFELKDDRLKAGMYLEGNYQTKVFENAVRVPAQAIVEESNVFVVKDGKASLKAVEVLEENTNQAVIRGLENGSKLIIDKKNSAFNGSEIIELGQE